MGKQHGVCPWQAGSLLAGSLRKLFHNPRRILEPFMEKGMTAMDVGCGMGFFTLPMADLVGDQGKVIAVDLQAQMLAGLMTKAEKARIRNIVTHLCGKTTLDLAAWGGTVDFAVMFWMLHEVPDAARLVGEVHAALSDGGKLLFVEPYVHVDAKEYQKSLEIITHAGFTMVSQPQITISRAALLQKS